jgi:hypothetical protein
VEPPVARSELDDAALACEALAAGGEEACDAPVTVGAEPVTELLDARLRLALAACREPVAARELGARACERCLACVCIFAGAFTNAVARP